ncbi:hypothetical protein [Microbacterium sediminis]|uniref:hypothetical protein n=1 Tax=Microbacterium sediminis TaxID=904291 RepID=UPI001072070C|nr:hypothetical protein [Microbacterium sediminis]QBR74798.1 hypothetical protein E3O41_10575 [Microbacterium sediminis]
MSEPALPARADALARRATMIVRIVGGIVGAFVIMNGVGRLTVGDYGALGIGGGGENPWEQANPAEAVLEDGVLSGPAGGSVLRIPAAEVPEGRLLEIGSFGGERTPYVDVDMTAPYAVGSGDVEYTDLLSLGWLDGDRPTVFFPGEGDVEIWFDADEAWTTTFGPAEYTPAVGGANTGQGDEILLYEGEGLSARAQHEGEGSFYVLLYQEEDDYDYPIIDHGIVDEGLTWSAGSAVAIVVESDGDPWTITIHEPEPAPTPSSTGSPTPSPTDTSAPAESEE